MQPTSSPQPASRFSDTAEHWAEKDIEFLAEKGIVKGVTDTEFMPDANITRAEFSALITRILGLQAISYNGQFTDVSSSDWFAETVAAIQEAGIMQGSDGYFRPNDNITREEAARVINVAYEKQNGQIPVNIQNLKAYQDNAEISFWARINVSNCITAGLMMGKTDDTFEPLANTTRAESVTILKRLMTKLSSTN